MYYTNFQNNKKITIKKLFNIIIKNKTKFSDDLEPRLKIILIKSVLQ